MKTQFFDIFLFLGSLTFWSFACELTPVTQARILEQIKNYGTEDKKGKEERKKKTE